VYPTEAGTESISNGLQVLGGYGYCTDFPLEQLYRDIRITTLYEGTTGIQSMDLMGRKILMKEGKALQLLAELVMEVIREASGNERLAPFAKKLGDEFKEMSDLTQALMKLAMDGKLEKYLSDATVYTEAFCNIVIAWQWLKQGIVAVKGGEMSPGFYESKLKTMEYFFTYELVRNHSLYDILRSENYVTLRQDGEENLI
jgi:butyryl-CoA dehydrogenase